jgi:hypothetical protein
MWIQQNFHPFNPLNTELNPICHLLALLGAHHILHISRIRANTFFILKSETIFITLPFSGLVSNTQIPHSIAICSHVLKYLHVDIHTDRNAKLASTFLKVFIDSVP